MRTVRRLIPLVLVLSAALPATALAGGWATVEVQKQPAGLGPGDPWRAELLVKQHGITPLDGLEPSVMITNEAGDTRVFVAKPAGKPGTYTVVVRYPSAGTWKTRIFDGFTDATPHRLPEYVVGGTGATTPEPLPAPPATAPAPATPSSGFPWPQTIAIALVALMLAAGLIAINGAPRLRVPRPGLGARRLRPHR